MCGIGRFFMVFLKGGEDLAGDFPDGTGDEDFAFGHD
jgi:hypothetical protein